MKGSVPSGEQGKMMSLMASCFFHSVTYYTNSEMDHMYLDRGYHPAKYSLCIASSISMPYKCNFLIIIHDFQA